MGRHKFNPEKSRHSMYRWTSRWWSRVPLQMRGQPNLRQKGRNWFKNDSGPANIYQVFKDYIGRYAVRKFRKGRQAKDMPRFESRRPLIWLLESQRGHKLFDDPYQSRELLSYI